MKRILYGLFLTASVSLAQSVPSDFSNSKLNIPTVPPSPEVGAMTKYGDQGINLFSGTANIAIPLGVVSGRDVSVPISLTYDSSGIKVDQLATWVGIGWNLQATGAVSRVNAGLPDDALVANVPYDCFYEDNLATLMQRFEDPVLEFEQRSAGDVFDYRQFKKKISEGKYETQPDYYRFSTPTGLSGKFFIDYSTDMGVAVENPNLIIEPTYHNPSYGTDDLRKLRSFKIIDVDGTQYFFEQEESNRSWYTVMDSGVPLDAYMEYTAAWHLTKIITGTLKDEIEFFYHPAYQWDNPQVHGAKTFVKNCIDIWGDWPTPPCDPTTDEPTTLGSDRKYLIDQLFLKEIHVNDTKRAQFDLSTAIREDLDGAKYLDNVKIFDVNGVLISTTNFNMDYFYASGAGTNPTEQEVRLKLNSLSTIYQGSGSQGSSDPETHTFEYFDTIDIPERLSFAQDYWGYYNGANNPDLVPRVETSQYVIPGANRDADLDHARVGTLKRINYPTGGYTTFDYALHPVDKQFSAVTGWNFIDSITGGLDTGSSDPYDYGLIDDSCDVPLHKIGTFQIDHPDTPLRIQTVFDPTGNANPCGTTWSVLVIYDHIAIPNPSLYDFKYDPSTRFFYQEQMQTIGNQDGEFEVDLPPGTYGYFMMNNNPDYTFTLQMSDAGYITEEVIYGGGLRVDRIKNYGANNEMISNKRYFYDDFYQANAPTNYDFQVASSGILQEPVDFTDYIYESSLEVVNGGFDVLWRHRGYLYRYANNQNTAMTNPVTYSVVSEINYSLQEEQAIPLDYTTTHFNNEKEYILDSPYSNDLTLNGKIAQQKMYSQANVLQSLTENSYTVDALTLKTQGVHYKMESNQDKMFVIYEHSPGTNYLEMVPAFKVQTTGGPWTKAYCGSIGLHTNTDPVVQCFDGPTAYHEKHNTSIQATWKRLVETKTTEYHGTASLQQTTNYYHDNPAHRQITRVERTNSKGQLVKDSLVYPEDIVSPGTIIQQLIADNRIASPLQKHSELNGNSSSFELTYQTVSNGTETRILPQKTVITKLGLPTTGVVYEAYDSYGNIQEIKSSDLTDALRTYYIWGYNGTRLLAEIKNKPNGSIPTAIQTMIDDLVSDSNTENSSILENYLRIEMQALRSQAYFANSMITSYTYDPEIGVTSMTDPRGYTTLFEYEAPGRLVKAVDADGNILSEYQYHYQTNN